jgi:hypothetical protein
MVAFAIGTAPLWGKVVIHSLSLETRSLELKLDARCEIVKMLFAIYLLPVETRNLELEPDAGCEFAMVVFDS